MIGAVTVLFLAGNTVALASTGHAFILGHSNKSGKISTLKRTTNGPALRLKTKHTRNAPMKVNGHGKVAHLNADKLDGRDASAFAPAAHAPVAAGFISYSGYFAHGYGISSAAWDPVLKQYVVTLSGGEFLLSQYAPTIAPAGCDEAVPHYKSSTGSDLAIYFIKSSDGTQVQCNFALTVTKLPTS